MGKRKIKLLMLGLMDRIEQINAILVEKNKYKNKDIENFYTTGEEDTYGEGTGSVYEGDADLTQIYCPLGNKIEIKIR